MTVPTRVAIDLHPDGRGQVYIDGQPVPKVRAIRIDARVNQLTTVTLELVNVELVGDVAAALEVRNYRLERSWWDRVVNAWRRQLG
jgi:hypothetical protein